MTMRYLSLADLPERISKQLANKPGSTTREISLALGLSEGVTGRYLNILARGARAKCEKRNGERLWRLQEG